MVFRDQCQNRMAAKRASVNNLPFELNGYDLHLRLCLYLNRFSRTILVGCPLGSFSTL